MFVFLAQKSGLLTNETTFAKILQNNGYKTALIGTDNVGPSFTKGWEEKFCQRWRKCITLHKSCPFPSLFDHPVN